MGCGCSNSCGCTLQEGQNVRVQRIGDKFIISALPVTSQIVAADATIDPLVNTVVFDGAPGSALELPPAIAGKGLLVWNIDVADDVDLTAAGTDTIHGTGTTFTLPALFTANLVCVADGTWLVNAY